MFRDCEDKLSAYFNRLDHLRACVDLRVVVAEGDSTDNTYGRLYDGPIDHLIKVDHHGERFESTDDPVRWAQIAYVARKIISEVDDPGDAFIWVEGDLLWDTATMLGLLDDLIEVRAVAPMVLHEEGRRFYDVFGFRKDGRPFQYYPPYYLPTEEPLVKIDSCGSCFAVSDFSLVHAWDGVWPFPAKGELWLDPALQIRHPRCLPVQI
jgi:hypothetical protein